MADNDPPPASAFELYVPMPYWTLFMLNFGIWLWYLVLRVTARYRIDMALVLGFTHPNVTTRSLCRQTESVLRRVTAATLINYTLYVFFVQTQLSWTLTEYFPLIGVVFTLTCLLYPALFSRSEPSQESLRFRETCKRIYKGSIDLSKRTNDILLADTITSYSRIIVDFLVYLSALMLGYRSLPLDSPKTLSKDHLTVYNVDILLSYYPSFVRLRQSVNEYRQSKDKSALPLFNAVKYATAIVPVVATVLLRSGIPGASALWFWGSFINSTCSFVWDVSNDWNLHLFKGMLSRSHQALVLRQRTTYPGIMYYAAILEDFVLRYLWVSKLLYPEATTDSGVVATALSSLHSTESGRLVSEALELCRRSIWILVKVEAAYCRALSNGDDIPLRKV